MPGLDEVKTTLKWAARDRYDNFSVPPWVNALVWDLFVERWIHLTPGHPHPLRAAAKAGGEEEWEFMDVKVENEEEIIDIEDEEKNEEYTDVKQENEEYTDVKQENEENLSDVKEEVNSLEESECSEEEAWRRRWTRNKERILQNGEDKDFMHAEEEKRETRKRRFATTLPLASKAPTSKAQPRRKMRAPAIEKFDLIYNRGYA